MSGGDDAEKAAEREKRLREAGARALAEAEARRAARPPEPPEAGGRKGLDPTRYSDWEKNGIASDF